MSDESLTFGAPFPGDPPTGASAFGGLSAEGSGQGPDSQVGADPAPGPPPVYLVGAPEGRAGGWRDRPVFASARWRPVPEWDPEALPPAGVVCIAAEDLSGAELVELLSCLARGRGEWLPLVVAQEGEVLMGRPLSLGYPVPVSEAASAEAHADGGRFPLELRRVLARISTVRHDVNNPLTSALAETQLLLMDVTEGETRGALETIQRQLRRMRDLIQASAFLRLTDA